jgi:hypothetical protein
MKNFIDYPLFIKDKEEFYKQNKAFVKHLRKELLKEKLSFLMKNKKLLVKNLFYKILPFFITIVVTYIVYILVSPPKIIKKTEMIYLKDIEKNQEMFLNKLAKLESNNNYKVVNRFGYMGKYQIGRQALIDIGLGSVSQESFLNNPELQEVAMKMLLKKNKQYLQSYIGKYQFKIINGIYITESGLLAGAHAVGYGAVIKWLESNGTLDPVDGNGVKVSKRISLFSNYKLIFN